jgi:hypothetical protein
MKYRLMGLQGMQIKTVEMNLNPFADDRHRGGQTSGAYLAVRGIR